MISKERFVETINTLKRIRDLEDDKIKINMNYEDILTMDYYEPFISHQFVIDLLSESVGLEVGSIHGNMIEYFIYEKNFGENFKVGDVVDQIDGKEYYPDISTPEKLYDYICENY